MFRRLTHRLPLAALLLLALPAHAAPETLAIDKGHTFVTFKVSHIGFAWIPGYFSEFDGELAYDPDKRADSKVTFSVSMPSLSTLHAERDKHLKSADFLDGAKHETATFTSTAYEPTGADTAILRGKLTLHGVTRPVEFKVTELAARKDPWGNFRRAFEAKGDIRLADFNISNFDGAVETAEVKVSLEAVRK